MPQKTWFKLQSKKKQKNFKQKVVKNSRHVLFFVQSHFWKDCQINCAMQKNHSRNITRYEIHPLTLNVLKSGSTRMHRRSNFLPWSLCVEILHPCHGWQLWLDGHQWQDHARPFQYWNALKEIKSSKQDEDHSGHGPHSDIYHNHNVCHSNDEFWRHSNDAGNDFLVQQNYRKNQQSNLPSVRSAMSALPLKGAQSLEHRVTIYLTVKNENNTGKICPEEQTNQGIKGLQYLSKYRTKPMFLAPQEHLQWSVIRCQMSNFQRGTGRAFRSPVVTAFVVPASFDP